MTPRKAAIRACSLVETALSIMPPSPSNGLRAPLYLEITRLCRQIRLVPFGPHELYRYSTTVSGP